MRKYYGVRNYSGFTVPESIHGGRYKSRAESGERCNLRALAADGFPSGTVDEFSEYPKSVKIEVFCRG
jgi:hypothetical protein